MIIISRENVSPLEVMQIKQILRESYCPNESLANTFERFAGFVDGKIFFDDAQDIWAEFAAPCDARKESHAVSIQPWRSGRCLLQEHR